MILSTYKYSRSLFWICGLILILCFGSSCAKSKKSFKNIRARDVNTLEILTNTSYTFTNRSAVHFDVHSPNIKNLVSGVLFGIESINEDGLSFRLLTGFDRLYYSNIGLGQSAKNYYKVLGFVNYHPKKQVKRFDPYIGLGSEILFSNSGSQAFGSIVLGFKYFTSPNTIIRVEAIESFHSDGLRSSLNLGIGFNF